MKPRNVQFLCFDRFDSAVSGTVEALGRIGSIESVGEPAVNPMTGATEVRISAALPEGHADVTVSQQLIWRGSEAVPASRTAYIRGRFQGASLTHSSRRCSKAFADTLTRCCDVNRLG